MNILGSKVCFLRTVLFDVPQVLGGTSKVIFINWGLSVAVIIQYLIVI